MGNLAQLWPYMARYWKLLVPGIVCAALGAAAAASGPYFLRLAIDDLNSGRVVLATLLWYGGLIILVACIDAVFKFGQRMLIAGVSYRVEQDLRTDLFDRLLLLDQSFYSRMYTGDLMARVTNDLSAVRQFLGPGFNGTVTASLTLLAAAVLMLAVDVWLTLVVLLLLPIVTLVFVLVGRRMRRIFTSVQDQFGVISSKAQENFSGIRTIKAYAQEEAEVNVFAAANEHYRSLNLRYVLLSGALWPSMTLILSGIAALVLLVGGWRVTTGVISIGALVQFNAYLALLAFPMIMVGWMLNLSQQASASMSRLSEVLNWQPQIADSPAPPSTTAIGGTIEFRNVGVRFETLAPALDAPQTGETPLERPADGWVLCNISFQVPQGGSLAIVGATGAGKTTLVHLLGRVRDPDTGQVLIDGRDIRQLPLAHLRRSIGYVPQETFLFSMSLRENILFGLPTDGNDNGALDARIDHAVAVSQLANDLEQFPDGLTTTIGERGVTLSGGQKQRVAIARAVLRDPAILVLDDALSSVDTHTAAEILAGLREVMRGRSSIIIAQRIATVKDADNIVVLHDGEIVEQGRHHDLIRQGGRYAAMYRRELLAAELEE